jgi:uncharacterized protein
LPRHRFIEEISDLAIRSMITLVLCFSHVIAGAAGQDKSPSPEPQPPLEESGQGAPLSPSEISQLKTKAEAGDATAARALAEAYVKGKRVTQSDALAANWYRKAAHLGDPEAQNGLGVMYSLGRGVEKSKEEAVRWYHSAAKQGYAQAMFNLGAAYYNGEGVPSDLDLAYAWFLLSQRAGNPEAKDAVARTAKEMKFTAAALEDIGAMYEKGVELPQNSAEAARWYGEAANHSDSAALRFAEMLINGKAIAQDYPRAFKLCHQAAEHRDGKGQYCLGYLYENGLGTEKNSKEAMKWYQLAASGLIPGTRRSAALALAEMYARGDGTKADHVEAYYWFVLAYGDGSSAAKKQCQALWPQLSKNEAKSVEKKLGERGIDLQKVRNAMQAQ